MGLQSGEVILRGSTTRGHEDSVEGSCVETYTITMMVHDETISLSLLSLLVGTSAGRCPLLLVYTSLLQTPDVVSSWCC